MNNNLKEKICFILENLYQATSAISVSLLGLNNCVICELGTIDTSLLTKNLDFVFSASDNLSSLCSINNNNNDYLSLIIKRNNISFLCVRINKFFSLICVYPKELEISKNLEDIEKIINKLIVVLNDLKKEGK